LITQMIVGADGVDIADILSGGSGEDVFEMRFAPSEDASAGGDLGTIVQISDFDASEDTLIVDLSAFPVFAQQVDATNQIDFQVVDRSDGSGSDVNFTVANADADAPLTGLIALEGVRGLTQIDVSLVFSGVDAET